MTGNAGKAAGGKKLGDQNTGRAISPAGELKIKRGGSNKFDWEDRRGEKGGT